MDFITILFIGVGLAMDACAVSLAKGMNLDKDKVKKYAFILALAFGLFQALMPAIGCRKSFCRLYPIHRSLDSLYFVELNRYQHD